MRRAPRIAERTTRIILGRSALILIAILGVAIWHGSGFDQGRWHNASEVCAGERVSLGDLPTQFTRAAAEYTREMTLFRNALINASGRAPDEICDDPELVRYTAQCYRLYATAAGIYGQILARVAPNASQEERREIQEGTRGLPDIPDMPVEDHLALAKTAQTFSQIEPGYTATIELSGMGNCGMRSVANMVRQVQKEEEARQRAAEERKNAVGDLLGDILGGGEPPPEGPEPTAEEPSAPAWDKARFAALYRQFNNAYREFKTHAKDFLDRLDQLAGASESEAHHICEDPTLAYSYSQADAQVGIITSAYWDVLRMAFPDVSSSDRNEMVARNLGIPPYTHLPVEDQIAFAEMQTNFGNAKKIAELIISDLNAKGAGCDHHDLEDAGRQIAESGQDPESGVDGEASPTGGDGGGGLTADFTGSPTNGSAPLAVNFTDMSYGGDIESYQWTFSDGGSSTAMNPSHTFENDGTYTVSLTVSGPDGSDTETKPGFVTVGSDQLTADFSGSPTSGSAPLAVNFTDLSFGGDIDTYQWTFGDGGSSIATNPSHTYQNNGTYNVSLTVSGPDGSDTETKQGYITVEDNSLRLFKTGDLWTSEITRADCSGGTMTLEITSEPILPDEIRPDGNYTVLIPVAWTVSGPNAEDFAFAAVLHLNGFNRLSDQIKSPRSGSMTFEFSFSGSEVRFSQGIWPLTIQVSGGVSCGSTQGEATSTYIQNYELHGGN